MKLRFAAIIPLATSIVAVVLSILLLSVGNDASSADVRDAWLTLNTTHAGQNLIQISQASNSTGSGNADPNSLEGLLNGLINGLMGNLTSAVNGAVQDLQGQLVGNITQQLGLRDTYLLFVTKVCEGNYTSKTDPEAATIVTKCYPYKDPDQGLRHISNSIPSSFLVGTTNVSVPLVQVLGDTLSSVNNIMTDGSEFMMAMLIIGVVCTGVAMLGSLVFIFTLRHRLLIVLYLWFAIIGSLAYWILAVVGTIISYAVPGLVGASGTGLGISVRTGSRYVALIWVAAVFAGLTAMWWYALWFVEFRRHAFRKRARTEEQIGDWRGIVAEVREDWRVHHDVKGDGKEGMVHRRGGGRVEIG